MNKVKPALVVILMALSTMAIGIAAQAETMQEKETVQQSLFDAEITFYLSIGDGCGCTPIVGASISAVGGEGSDYGVTDEDGYCTLTLVIDGEYRVQIEAEGYVLIMYDFVVIDDQSFSFHMQEEEESSIRAVPLFYRLLSKILD